MQYDLSLPDISDGYPGVIQDSNGWRNTSNTIVPADICLAYCHLTKQLRRTVKFSQGDLLNYIEVHHGSKYDIAVHLFGCSRQTLMNAVSVANAWPLEQRGWNTLCWSMFAATASLQAQHDERAILMDRAVAGNWTVEQMEDEVAELKRALFKRQHPGMPVLVTKKTTCTGKLLLDGNRVIFDILEGNLPPTDWNGLFARMTLTVEVHDVGTVQVALSDQAVAQAAPAL